MSRAWTPEEDATLRAVSSRARRGVKKLDRAAIMAALPGRTWDAVLARRGHLGIDRSRRRWTPAENAVLRAQWRENAVRTIMAALPGRSWCAISRQAAALGLGTVQQGWVLYRAEYQRLGLCRSEADHTIAWANAWAPLVDALCAWGYAVARFAGVEPDEHDDEHDEHHVAVRAGEWDTGAVATKLLTTVTTTRIAWRMRRSVVEAESLEAALVRRLRWETLAVAARRLGIDRQALGRAIATQRWVRAAPHLLPPEWFDAAAETAGLRPGGRAIREHARRCGTSSERVRAALRGVGMLRGRGRGARGYYLDAEVDAALAAYDAKPWVARCAMLRGARRSA